MKMFNLSQTKYFAKTLITNNYSQLSSDN